MSYLITAVIMLAIGVIGGVIGGYFVYRNNQKKINDLICRYDKAMCEKKEDCGC